MHIKEIIIDGFKSYSIKTSLQGLDAHFNAITGLNGSGKSNIFDALCFLLGITSLSNVRASNLQDLIYKKGNAGINKASVTVIFDNKDKNLSPIGCESYDEIIICRTIYQGKSKYYLNGYNATQENIKSLFLSVQLNINNPHFLIMQGKVRQVVHMKPIEILGLLEEAAGTSIYEMRKESSLKMIKKKENKLEEINQMLNNEITPQLKQLMEDKQNYLTWKSREDELQRILKIITANDYYESNLFVNTKTNELVQYKNQRDEMQLNLNNILKDIEEIEKNILEMENKYKDKIDSNVKELEKKEKSIKSNINSENFKKETTLKNIKSSENEIEKQRKENETRKALNDNLEKQKKDLNSNQNMFENDLKNQKEYLKNIEISLSNCKNGKNDNISMLNYDKLISEAVNNKNKSLSEKNNLKSQIQYLKEELNSKKEQLKVVNSKLKSSKNEYNNYQNKIKEIEKNIENINKEKINSQIIESIKKKIENNQIEISKLEKIQNEILSRYGSRLELQYRDPELNFNRNKVKGRVIRNFKLKNEKYARAIEQIAGGKLYNIIVDNENTSSILLQKKCFDYSVTLIPLNKITYRKLDEMKIKKIEEDTNNEAQLSLNLIEYNKEFDPAMKYVFGQTFICSTSEIARKIAYGGYKFKCVNLDGDIFDPNGLMTGGAVINKESILKKVVELNAIQNKINSNKEEVFNYKKELDYIINQQKLFIEYNNQLELLKKESLDFDKDIILKNINSIESDISKIEDEIKRSENRIFVLNDFEKKYNEEYEKLIKEKKDFDDIGNNNSKKEKVFEKKIQESKKLIQQIEKSINKIKKEINDIEYKITKSNNEIKESEEIIKSENENLESTKKELIKITENINEYEEILKKISVELYEKKSELTKNENELKTIREERENKIEQRDNYNSDIKKLDLKIQKYEKEIKESTDRMKKLEKENPFIISERNFFGMKDTDYDFSKINCKNEYKRYQTLKEENEILKRKVNMKAETMSEQYEKQYNDLIKKREIINKDKINIQKAIDELDEKRKIALEEIFIQVNNNLNSIYSTLLPSTKAKIERINENDLMKGVQLKVAFNNQWKKSLSELSGGQSSLLALSLILSLLLYKPAPIYIFDEIDAALDLSHTANLGVMIKNHFPQSQFIIISLKDGMFNNANVLYKVNYVDGSSRIERITKNKL